MLARVIFLIFFFNCSLALTIRELHDAYWQIFPRTGNRNAASHIWTTYVIDKVKGGTHTEDEIYKLFSSFCPVSGSIVTPTPSWNLWTGLKVKESARPSWRPYQIELPATGSVYTCCWPCICDIQEFVKVDTLKINTRDKGEILFPVLVIGDPCIDESRIPQEASELKCNNGVLEKTTLSRGRHIVIGMLQKATYSVNTAQSKQAQCDNRRLNNYQWGMGKIFLKVAQINPVP